MLDEVARALRNDARFCAWQVSEARGRSAQRYQVFTRVESRRLVETRQWDVRVHVPLEGGRIGESSFTLVDPAQPLSPELDAAYARARLVNNPAWTLPAPDEVAARAIVTADARIVEAAAEVGDEVARAVEGSVARAGGVELSASEVFCDYRRVHLVNSRGVDRTREDTHVYAEYVLLARGAGDDEIEVYQSRRARGAAALEVEQQVADDIVAVRDGARAVLPATGLADVVIADAGVEELFDAFVAHAAGTARFEGWSRFEPGAHVVDGARGDLLTLASDATVPGGLGSYAFDDVGCSGRRVDCVVDGVFRERACDRRTACWLGLPTTGAWGNTVVAPGRSSMDELLTPGERPLFLLTRFSQLSPHATTGAFAGEIRAGYRLDRGGRTPVRGGSISGVVFDAFARARFSAETATRGRLHGPRAVRLDQLQVTGGG
ncbi:MAG: hypothetical protein IT383_17320 [Deltaproteobacteria bacterium]|nr:hypothetical protein [Deltaproteobacteria bacterium]